MQHVPDLSIRKAEVFIIFHICNRQHAEVVNPGENTLFCNPQAPGQHCKVEAAVALQSTAEKTAD